MIEKINTNHQETKAILIGLIHGRLQEEQVVEYLDELEFLASTAGAISTKKFIQKLSSPDSKTFIGKGKLEEIKTYVQANAIQLVIFDDELTPSQIRNVQEHVQVKIIDRPALILDIFANRARTAQAKVQVELAQYQYLLPRLKGLWSHLERQGAGIGSRGPGETEIETDRRIVQDKISLLKKQLEQIQRQAHTQRQERQALIRVALVGYTNVGKSTIMNLLSKSTVLAENKLFATLDTTTRKVVLEQTPFLLSDTVGFIRKLPHHLVESFKTTLQEAQESDILLHIIDISHTHYEEQIKVVDQTLSELKITNKKTIFIFNKMDDYKKKYFDEWLDKDVEKKLLIDLHNRWQEATNTNCIFMSAFQKEDIVLLRETLLKEVQQMYKIRYPYQKSWY